VVGSVDISITDRSEGCFEDPRRNDTLGLGGTVAEGLARGLALDEGSERIAAATDSGFPESVSTRVRPLPFTIGGSGGGNSSRGEDDFLRGFSRGGAITVCPSCASSASMPGCQEGTALRTIDDLRFCELGWSGLSGASCGVLPPKKGGDSGENEAEIGAGDGRELGGGENAPGGGGGVPTMTAGIGLPLRDGSDDGRYADGGADPLVTIGERRGSYVVLPRLFSFSDDPPKASLDITRRRRPDLLLDDSSEIMLALKFRFGGSSSGGPSSRKSMRSLALLET